VCLRFVLVWYNSKRFWFSTKASTFGLVQKQALFGLVQEQALLVW
jgi:hypothetical protein